MSGPLTGLKVIEVAGIGPGPFTAMMLADMGADVIRVDRANQVAGYDPATPPGDSLNRGRRSLGLDLKSPEGIAVLLDLEVGRDRARRRRPLGNPAGIAVGEHRVGAESGSNIARRERGEITYPA